MSAAEVVFVEIGLGAKGIDVDIYIGGRDAHTGTITLTLDEWSELREHQDGSPVVAMTKKEWEASS